MKEYNPIEEAKFSYRYAVPLQIILYVVLLILVYPQISAKNEASKAEEEEAKAEALEAKARAEAFEAAELRAKAKAEKKENQLANNASGATTELESVAKKWQIDAKTWDEKTYNYKCSYTVDGQYFSFSSKKHPDEEGYMCYWTATSKIKIGDCPAKSIWKMEYSIGEEEGEEFRSNQIPPKCKAITPEAISNYK